MSTDKSAGDLTHMKRQRRIGVVSPLPLVAQDISDAFSALWPEAEVVNVIDDSLYTDYIGKGRIMTEDVRARVESALRHCQTSRPDVLLFSGSVFGDVIKEMRPRFTVPVVAALDGLVADAFDAGRRFGILTTSPFSNKDLQRDLALFGKHHDNEFTFSAKVHEEARRVILVDKDRERHDQMLLEMAAEFTDIDVLLLGQFSLGTAYNLISQTSKIKVLSAARSSVNYIRKLLDEGGLTPAE